MVYYVNEGSVYAISIIFPVVCSICTGLRFYARKVKHLRYEADDYMSLVALVSHCAILSLYRKELIRKSSS